MASILLIEDDESIVMPLQDDLELDGFKVQAVNNGSDGLREAKKMYDLIVLDIMLPDVNGFDICRQLRRENINTPILILTAKREEIDKVLGLELGADDYLTKPFSRRELLARVHAILRRVHMTQQSVDVYSFGDVVVDFIKFEIQKNNRPIHLTSLEVALLHYFVANKEQVLSRDQILDKIWGEEVYVTPRTVDTHIANLRKKLEDDPAHPKHFLGVRGVGYKFVD